MTVKINATALKVFLVQRGMEQKDLAEQSGVSEQTIVRLLKGKAFTSDTLGKLAEALNVNPVDLIQSDGHPDPLVEAQAV